MKLKGNCILQSTIKRHSCRQFGGLLMKNAPRCTCQPHSNFIGFHMWCMFLVYMVLKYVLFRQMDSRVWQQNESLPWKEVKPLSQLLNAQDPLKSFLFFHIVELHFHSLCSKWNTYYGNCNNLLLIIFHVSTVLLKMTIIMIMYCIYLISGIDAVTHSNSVHLLMCWLFDWGNICVCRDIEMFIKSLIQMATPAGDVTLVVACTICDLSCSFVSPHITYELWFL